MDEERERNGQGQQEPYEREGTLKRLLMRLLLHNLQCLHDCSPCCSVGFCSLSRS